MGGLKPNSSVVNPEATSVKPRPRLRIHNVEELNAADFLEKKIKEVKGTKMSEEAKKALLDSSENKLAVSLAASIISSVSTNTPSNTANDSLSQIPKVDLGEMTLQNPDEEKDFSHLFIHNNKRNQDAEWSDSDIKRNRRSSSSSSASSETRDFFRHAFTASEKILDPKVYPQLGTAPNDHVKFKFLMAMEKIEDVKGEKMSEESKKALLDSSENKSSVSQAASIISSVSTNTPSNTSTTTEHNTGSNRNSNRSSQYAERRRADPGLLVDPRRQASLARSRSLAALGLGRSTANLSLRTPARSTVDLSLRTPSRSTLDLGRPSSESRNVGLNIPMETPNRRGPAIHSTPAVMVGLEGRGVTNQVNRMILSTSNPPEQSPIPVRQGLISPLMVRTPQRSRTFSNAPAQFPMHLNTPPGTPSRTHLRPNTFTSLGYNHVDNDDSDDDTEPRLVIDES